MLRYTNLSYPTFELRKNNLKKTDTNCLINQIPVKGDMEHFIIDI